MNVSKFYLFRSLIFIGYFLTSVGCLLLLFGVLGLFNIEAFAYGLSSGIRIIGSLAIAGCMTTAAGYFFLEQE